MNTLKKTSRNIARTDALKYKKQINSKPVTAADYYNAHEKSDNSLSF